MKRTLTSLAAVALLAACGGGGDAAPSLTESMPSTPTAPTSPTSPTAPTTPPAANTSAADEVVVMLATGVAIGDIAARYGATVLDQFGQRPIYRLRLAAPATLDATLAAMRADSRVRFAELNFESETPERRRQLVWAIGGSADIYATQWVPTALGLPQAHALSTGAGVRVAVLDTGVDTAHPALSGRLARSTGGAVLGRDFVDGDDDANEAGSATDTGWGHGTHVAGLVALAAPAAQLMPVRVLDASGRGNVWVLAEALLWAADPDGNPATDDGAHVINLSLGTTAPTQLLDAAIELITCKDDDADIDTSDPGFEADRERCRLGRGIVVVAAAGNGGSSSELQYPAAEGVEGQLAVTASTESGRLASFANRGPWVQLAAPGEGIVSTLPGGGYATWSGSSMASPLVAGVAALLRARQPDWKAVDVTKRIEDRSVRLCATELRGLQAHAAVADFVPPDTACN
jgi:subtilisin family serine protease